MADRALERLRLLGRGALARGLDRTRALEAEQWGVLVGGEHELDPGQAVEDRRQPEERVVGCGREGGATPGQRRGGPRTEGGEHAGTGVVRAASPHADDDLPGTRGDRGLEELADPPRARQPRVALVGAEQVEPARLRRLDVCREATTGLDDEHRRRHLAAQGVAHGGGDRGASQGPGQHVEEAGSAVRQRQQLDVVVRRARRPSLRHGRRRLDGAEGGAEGVRSDEHAHSARLSAPRAPRRAAVGGPR